MADCIESDLRFIFSMEFLQTLKCGENRSLVRTRWHRKIGGGEVLTYVTNGKAISMTLSLRDTGSYQSILEGPGCRYNSWHPGHSCGSEIILIIKL